MISLGHGQIVVWAMEWPSCLKKEEEEEKKLAFLYNGVTENLNSKHFLNLSMQISTHIWN